MIVNQSPRSSALVRSIQGDAATWGPTEHLLALVFDTLQAANWQRASKKSLRKPKPIKRPEDARDVRKRRAGARPITEIAALLGWSKV